MQDFGLSGPGSSSPGQVTKLFAFGPTSFPGSLILPSPGANEVRPWERGCSWANQVCKLVHVPAKLILGGGGGGGGGEGFFDGLAVEREEITLLAEKVGNPWLGMWLNANFDFL